MWQQQLQRFSLLISLFIRELIIFSKWQKLIALFNTRARADKKNNNPEIVKSLCLGPTLSTNYYFKCTNVLLLWAELCLSANICWPKRWIKTTLPHTVYKFMTTRLMMGSAWLGWKTIRSIPLLCTVLYDLKMRGWMTGVSLHCSTTAFRARVSTDSSKSRAPLSPAWERVCVCVCGYTCMCCARLDTVHWVHVDELK